MDFDDVEKPDERIKHQFQYDNQWQKKVTEFRQKDEYKHIDKHYEGLCYGCWSKKFVIPWTFQICANCVDKRGDEPILNGKLKQIMEFCFFCENHHERIFELNARLCEKCAFVVAKAHKRYEKTGRYDINPFYKSVKRKLGADWKILLSQPSDRRF